MIYNITDIVPREPTNPFLRKPTPKIAALIQITASPPSLHHRHSSHFPGHLPKEGVFVEISIPRRKRRTPALQGSPGRAPSSPDWGPSRPLLLLRSALTPRQGSLLQGRAQHVLPQPSWTWPGWRNASTPTPVGVPGCHADSQDPGLPRRPQSSSCRERAAPTGC